MSGLGWELPLMGMRGGRVRELARASREDDTRRIREDVGEDERWFVGHSANVANGQHVVLGQTEVGVPYRISLHDLTSLPSWITAGTGAGKSRLLGGVMLQVLEHLVRGAPVSIVVIDGKGETADQFLRSLAQLLEGSSEQQRRWVLARTHTFRFFDRAYLPSWPLLAPTPGVSAPTQADVVAEVLCENASDATLGPRQRLMLARMCALAIEQNLPIATLPWLLSSPAQVASLAGQSSIPAVRLDLSRFDRESQSSIDGLVSRLGILLGVPSLKAVLSGGRVFDFATCFEPGAITVMDFGGAEMGARAAVRAMGSLAISALGNGAFDPRRTVRGTTMIVLDEPQAFLNSVSLGQYERLVTMGRSLGAGGLVFTHQGPTQLPVEFQTILNTNIALRILGRSSERDANAASEWLPRTGRVPRPREPGSRRQREAAFLTESQELRHRLEQGGKLPARNFLVADRRAPFAPRVIEALNYNPPQWSSIRADVAEAVRRGMVGTPRRELERRVSEIEAAAEARFLESREAEPRPGRKRGRAVETPDVVGRGSEQWRGVVP
jgi:hypothetical protein